MTPSLIHIYFHLLFSCLLHSLFCLPAFSVCCLIQFNSIQFKYVYLCIEIENVYIIVFVFLSDHLFGQLSKFNKAFNCVVKDRSLQNIWPTSKLYTRNAMKRVPQTANWTLRNTCRIHKMRYIYLDFEE